MKCKQCRCRSKDLWRSGGDQRQRHAVGPRRQCAPLRGSPGANGGKKKRENTDQLDQMEQMELAMDWLGPHRTGRAQPESPNNSTVAFIRANQKPDGTSQLPSTRVPRVMLAAGTPLVRSKGAGTPNAGGSWRAWRCWLSHKTITPPSCSLPTPPSSPLRILPNSLPQTNDPFCTPESVSEHRKDGLLRRRSARDQHDPRAGGKFCCPSQQKKNPAPANGRRVATPPRETQQRAEQSRAELTNELRSHTHAHTPGATYPIADNGEWQDEHLLTRLSLYRLMRPSTPTRATRAPPCEFLSTANLNLASPPIPDPTTLTRA